jgi:hypothetical protein
LFNLFGFRERSQLSPNGQFLIYESQECDNGFDIIGKSMNVSVGVVLAHFERRIENLMNLRHPCISRTICVVVPSPLQEL